MFAPRAIRLSTGLLNRAAFTGAASLFVLAAAGPAHAQVADDVVLNIMRECARIDDPTARLACYDNNIRNAAAPRSTIPGEVQAQGGGAVPVARATRPIPRGAAPIGGTVVYGAPGSNGVSGFGREDVLTPERFNSAPAGELDAIQARVTEVRPRQPGVYALTLEDGAEWLFTEGVSSSYRVPRAGSIVEIRRAAMDSFLMTFDQQAAVRIRRVR